MKNRFVGVLFVLSAVLLFLSCSKPNSTEETATLSLKGTQETIEIGSQSAQVPISFSTSQSWTATADVQWISLSAENGPAGDASISAKVEENKTNKQRTGTVTIKAGSLSKNIRINQSSNGGDTPSKETLIIAVTVTEYTTFTISITSNTQKTYFFDVVEKVVWDKDGGENVWKSSFNKDALQSGNSRKEYTYQKAKTEFVAFAAFCDEKGNREGDFFTDVFVTDIGLDDDDHSTITFSLSNVTESSYTLVTSSSSNKQYFFDVISKELWDDNDPKDVWKAYVDYYIQDGSFKDQLVSGDHTCDFTVEDQEFVAFAAYCNNDGTLKSTIFSREFNLADYNNDPTLSWVGIDTGLSLVVGENKTLTVKGEDENYDDVESPKVKWQSNNPSVATVDQNGNVKAVGAGIAIITAKATKGDASDNCKVLVVSDASYYDTPLDLGLSVKWAQHNIGATRPEGFGQYYTWGATETWSAAKITCPYHNYSWSSKKDEVVDSDYNLYRTFEPVHILLGNNWRLPTKKECEELIENCSVEHMKINGKIGDLYISKKTGYTDKWIFLPHTGYCWAGQYANANEDYCTYYWSSTINPNAVANLFSYETAWTLCVDKGDYEPEIGCCTIDDGAPIRPVYSDKLYFEIIVSDLTSNQCIVTTGTNSTNTYYSTVVSKSYLDQYDAKTLCQALISYSKNDGTLGDHLYQGDISLRYNDFNANSEQAVIAIFCDNNGTTSGNAYSKIFKTK
jgi:hypothetical protein